MFITVAERQSFAAAAQQLNMSRSAITRAIGDLESELGVQLLVRTTRSVSLTLAGSLYLERTRAITLDLERADALVREQQSLLKGALRLNAPLSLGLRFLPDVLSQFRILHPDITMTVDLADRFIDILSEDYDMALRISGPPDDKSTIWRKICVVPRDLVASTAYLSRFGTPAQPQELRMHQCLGYSNFAGRNELVLKHVTTGETEIVQADHRFLCNNGDLLLEMALRHEGIALLPRFITGPSLASGALQTVLDDWQSPQIWLTAFYPPYAFLPAKVQRLTSFIEAAISQRADLFPPHVRTAEGQGATSHAGP